MKIAKWNKILPVSILCPRPNALKNDRILLSAMQHTTDITKYGTMNTRLAWSLSSFVAVREKVIVTS